jgi:hypothetical protein
MIFTATWFAGEEPISSEEAGSLAGARDIARSRLLAHKAGSGATHVEVRAEGGALLFSSSAGMTYAGERRPRQAMQSVNRRTIEVATSAQPTT